MATIRTATDADAAHIARLWNGFIRDTTVTFTTLEKSHDQITTLIDSRPVLVAETDGFAGFATWGPFRAGPGYAHTAEVSVFAQHPGDGSAQALLAAAESQARTQGIHVLIAGISGENARAIRFFQRQGYAKTAEMPQVGRKFERWLDLILMQKLI